MSVQDLLMSYSATPTTPPGQIVFTSTGTSSWTVPEGVFSVCAVLVGNPTTLTYDGVLQCRAQNGSRIGDGGGDGGPGGTGYVGGSGRAYGGGGGAGGYLGNGGAGGNGGFGTIPGSPGDPNSGAAAGGNGAIYYAETTRYGQYGGGVGLKGIGSTGSSPGEKGSGGSDGTSSGDGLYGGGVNSGGPGGALSYKNHIPVIPGQTISLNISSRGAARIIWGTGREFPGTNTIDL